MMDTQLSSYWHYLNKDEPLPLKSQMTYATKIWLKMNKAIYENRISGIERVCILLEQDGTETQVFREYEVKIDVSHGPTNNMLNHVIAEVLMDKTIRCGLDVTPITRWEIVQTKKLEGAVKIVKERKVDIDNRDPDCINQRDVFPARIMDYINYNRLIKKAEKGKF